MEEVTTTGEFSALKATQDIILDMRVLRLPMAPSLLSACRVAYFFFAVAGICVVILLFTFGCYIKRSNRTVARPSRPLVVPDTFAPPPAPTPVGLDALYGLGGDLELEPLGPQQRPNVKYVQGTCVVT